VYTITSHKIEATLERNMTQLEGEYLWHGVDL
jgi:hypothetical protein